jgi:hypothetical protein
MLKELGKATYGRQEPSYLRFVTIMAVPWLPRWAHLVPSTWTARPVRLVGIAKVGGQEGFVRRKGEPRY